MFFKEEDQKQIDSNIDELGSKLDDLSLKTKQTKQDKPNRRRSSETPESLTDMPEAIKKGNFFQHDSRADEVDESKEGQKAEQGRKSPEKWSHDKFDDRDPPKKQPQREPKGQRSQQNRQQGNRGQPRSKPDADDNKGEASNIEAASEQQAVKENKNRRSGGNQSRQPGTSNSEVSKSDGKGLPLSEYLGKSTEEPSQDKVSLNFN